MRYNFDGESDELDNENLFRSKDNVREILYMALGLQKNKISSYMIGNIVQGGREALFLLQNFFGVDYRKIDKQRMKEIVDYISDDFFKRFEIMENDVETMGGFK